MNVDLSGFYHVDARSEMRTPHLPLVPINQFSPRGGLMMWPDIQGVDKNSVSVVDKGSHHKNHNCRNRPFHALLPKTFNLEQ